MMSKNVLIAHPKSEEEIDALKAVLKALKIKFEVTTSEKSPYNPEFVAKIQKSREDYKKGKGTAISLDELDELWK